MGVQEKSIEDFLVKSVKGIGGEIRKFTSPGHSGVFDRIVFYAGFVLLVECKSAKGKLSPTQIEERRKMDQQDIWSEVVFSKQDVVNLIEELKKKVKARKVLIGAIEKHNAHV
jgi:hypothetical protein